jgi:hypothetical protein
MQHFAVFFLSMKFPKKKSIRNFSLFSVTANVTIAVNNAINHRKSYFF